MVKIKNKCPILYPLLRLVYKTNSRTRFSLIVLVLNDKFSFEFLFRIAYRSRRHIPGETATPIELYNIGTTEIMNTRRNPLFNVWQLHTVLVASKVVLNSAIIQN